MGATNLHWCTMKAANSFLVVIIYDLWCRSIKHQQFLHYAINLCLLSFLYLKLFTNFMRTVMSAGLLSDKRSKIPRFPKLCYNVRVTRRENQNVFTQYGNLYVKQKHHKVCLNTCFPCFVSFEKEITLLFSRCWQYIKNLLFWRRGMAHYFFCYDFIWVCES